MGPNTEHHLQEKVNIHSGSSLDKHIYAPMVCVPRTLNVCVLLQIQKLNKIFCGSMMPEFTVDHHGCIFGIV